MNRLALALAVFVSLIGSAFAQGGMMPGPGTPHTTGGGFSLAYASSATSTTTSTTVSYSGLTWPSGCGVLAIADIWYNTNTADVISSMTVAGAGGATQIPGVATGSSGPQVTLDAWQLVSPPGTGGTISVTYSATTSYNSTIAVYCIVTTNTTAVGAKADNGGTGTAFSQSINVPTGGGAIAFSGNQNGFTTTFTNATQDIFLTTGGIYSLYGHTTSTGTVSVTVTPASTGYAVLGLAAWGP